VRHLGFVRREFLYQLMAGARALVYFSQFEGFGMPLLEAFAAGTPVLCSNAASLPEVGGEAVLKCAATDVPAMSALMIRVLDDEPLRRRLIACGNAQLQRYRWQDSAAALLAACERVHHRAAVLSDLALPALRRLSEHFAMLEADRAERLTAIEQLRAAVPPTPAAGLYRRTVRRLVSRFTTREAA
jgi:hypothetical protein